MGNQREEELRAGFALGRRGGSFGFSLLLRVLHLHDACHDLLLFGEECSDDSGSKDNRGHESTINVSYPE